MDKITARPSLRGFFLDPGTSSLLVTPAKLIEKAADRWAFLVKVLGIETSEV